MDKEWYAKRDPKTEEPTKIAKIYVTVYYAEKGEQMVLCQDLVQVKMRNFSPF